MSTAKDNIKNIDIRTVDRDTLIDINDIKINTNLPEKERIIDFINQIKNPYCYKCGNIIVKLSFAETHVTLEDKLESYLLSL